MRFLFWPWFIVGYLLPLQAAEPTNIDVGGIECPITKEESKEAKFIMTHGDESCDKACAQLGLHCDAGILNLLGPDDVLSFMERSVRRNGYERCDKYVKSRTKPYHPSVSYHLVGNASHGGVCEGYDSPGSSAPSCSAKPPRYTNRFCFCKESIMYRLQINYVSIRLRTTEVNCCDDLDTYNCEFNLDFKGSNGESTTLKKMEANQRFVVPGEDPGLGYNNRLDLTQPFLEKTKFLSGMTLQIKATEYDPDTGNDDLVERTYTIQGVITKEPKVSKTVIAFSENYYKGCGATLIFEYTCEAVEGDEDFKRKRKRNYRSKGKKGKRAKRKSVKRGKGAKRKSVKREKAVKGRPNRFGKKKRVKKTSRKFSVINKKKSSLQKKSVGAGKRKRRRLSRRKG